MNQNILNIKLKIAKGELEIALEKLQEIAKESPLLNEVILHSSRLSDLSKRIHKGIIKYDDAEITKNQITDGILSLIDEIDFESRNNQDVKDELDKFFLSHEKLKEEEGEMTIKEKKRRFQYFDNYDELLQSKPPNEKFGLQKLNSEVYLKRFGLSVKDLKSKLNGLNYYDGTLDNKFNRELVNSLEIFQLDNSMRHIDGFFGELTYDMIVLRLKEKKN